MIPAESIKPYFCAIIKEIERSKKILVIRFNVDTNIQNFRASQFIDVRRTYEEFIKLGKHLSVSNPECLVPPLPPSSTSAGLGLDDETKHFHIRMQKWLDIISANSILIQDEELVYFIESHFGYSPIIQKDKPASGLKRKAIKMQGPPPDDTPELSNLRPIIKKFYQQTTESCTKFEKIIKTLRSLSISEDELGLRFSSLADMEHHSGMANAFRKLGKTIQTISHSYLTQANTKAVILTDTFSYISSDAFVVKVWFLLLSIVFNYRQETLTNRQILIKELLSAQASSRSKLSTITRLKSSASIKSERVNEILTSLEETRSYEQNLNMKLTRVTTNLLQEGRQWINRTSNDIKLALQEYTKRQIEYERRLLVILESARPDIRNIDNTGGLSRLGRGFTQTKNRNDINSSQTAQGDAWSGIQRQKNHINKEPESQFIKKIDDILDARSAFATLAMGAIFTASKITERPAKIRDIINVFSGLIDYRKGKPIIVHEYFDQIFYTTRDQILVAEITLLSSLGFDTFVELPYALAIHYLQILDLIHHTAISQKVWSYINDALCTTLPCIQTAPSIAVGCIFMATRDEKIQLPSAWWEIFDVEVEDIEYIAACITSFYIQEEKRKNKEIQGDLIPLELEELEGYLKNNN
ncbi:hypothetical protein PCK2_000637 [Pneumocystis canis]|nr:hypothetical protein PCK2_000637 [Pneumocystis canis]